MKARLQRLRQQTAILVERAQRAMRDSRKLLEQREMQLKQLDQFLEQNPSVRVKYSEIIADVRKKRGCV